MRSATTATRNAWNYAHRNNHCCKTHRRNQTTPAAPAAHTRYLSSPAAATLHGKTQGFVLRLPPHNTRHATFMQPFQCDLQPQLQETHRTTHAGTTIVAKQIEGTKRPQPHPPHTRGTFHRRLQPLYTEKHKVSCSGFLPTTLMILQPSGQPSGPADQRISGSVDQRISGSADQRTSGSADQRISGSADQRISGSADQRISGSADQRISGPADQRISGSADQRISGSADQRISGPADQRISGSADQRISGSADQRTSGSADQRISGSADQRISGSADQRISGPADQRISGPADQRISGSADQRTEPGDPRISSSTDSAKCYLFVLIKCFPHTRLPFAHCRFILQEIVPLTS